MGSIEQWLPNMIQAGTAVGQLLLGVADRRVKQAQEWGEQVERLAELEGEELRRAVEDDPVAAEIVGRALEAAARTASDDKCYLLAKVAAAALRGDAAAQVDHLQFLLRTVMELDPAHVTLLVLIGTLEDSDNRSEGPEHRRADRSDLDAKWPSASDLMEPALAALERAGLIQGYLDASEPLRSWQLLPYGPLFLDYLLIDAGGWPLTGRAP